MGSSKEVLCSLCLNIVNDKQFEVIKQNAIHMLEALFLKKDFDHENEHLMCNSCSLKLSAAFKFKENCIDIENTVISYAKLQESLPLDLAELYGKEKLKGCLISETNCYKICRLCMQLINDEFILAQKIMPDAVELYVPEINFSITKDPLICKSCWDSLSVHISFIKDCLNAMTGLSDTDIKENRDVDSHSSLIYSCIKTEPVETMSESGKFLQILNANTEQNEVLIKNEEVEIGFEESEQNGYILETLSNETLTIEQHADTEHLPENITVHDPSNDHKSDKPNPNSLLHENTLHLYKCNSCDFISENAADVERHALVHKEPSEIQTCICATCEARRMPRKKRRSRGRTIYKCQKCGFQTKRRYALEIHKCSQRDPGERPFSCDSCPYRAKKLISLKRHELKHLDPSQLEMFPCPSCNFSAKSKDDLKRHVVRQHTSNTETFKCSLCVFETKYKYNLRTHVFNHGHNRLGGKVYAPRVQEQPAAGSPVEAQAAVGGGIVGLRLLVVSSDVSGEVGCSR